MLTGKLDGSYLHTKPSLDFNVTDAFHHMTAPLPDLHPPTLMPKLDFQSAVKQEEDRLRRLHPTPGDIPGCLSLFDGYLSCTGTSVKTCPSHGC